MLIEAANEKGIIQVTVHLTNKVRVLIRQEVYEKEELNLKLKAKQLFLWYM